MAMVNTCILILYRRCGFSPQNGKEHISCVQRMQSRIMKEMSKEKDENQKESNDNISEEEDC